MFNVLHIIFACSYMYLRIRNFCHIEVESQNEQNLSLLETDK